MRDTSRPIIETDDDDDDDDREFKYTRRSTSSFQLKSQRSSLTQSQPISSSSQEPQPRQGPTTTCLLSELSQFILNLPARTTVEKRWRNEHAWKIVAELGKWKVGRRTVGVGEGVRGGPLDFGRWVGGVEEVGRGMRKRKRGEGDDDDGDQDEDVGMENDSEDGEDGRRRRQQRPRIVIVPEDLLLPTSSLSATTEQSQSFPSSSFNPSSQPYFASQPQTQTQTFQYSQYSQPPLYSQQYSQQYSQSYNSFQSTFSASQLPSSASDLPRSTYLQSQSHHLHSKLKPLQNPPTQSDEAQLYLKNLMSFVNHLSRSDGAVGIPLLLETAFAHVRFAQYSTAMELLERFVVLHPYSEDVVLKGYCGVLEYLMWKKEVGMRRLHESGNGSGGSVERSDDEEEEEDDLHLHTNSKHFSNALRYFQEIFNDKSINTAPVNSSSSTSSSSSSNRQHFPEAYNHDLFVAYYIYLLALTENYTLVQKVLETFRLAVPDNPNAHVYYLLFIWEHHRPDLASTDFSADNVECPDSAENPSWVLAAERLLELDPSHAIFLWDPEPSSPSKIEQNEDEVDTLRFLSVGRGCILWALLRYQYILHFQTPSNLEPLLKSLSYLARILDVRNSKEGSEVLWEGVLGLVTLLNGLGGVGVDDAVWVGRDQWWLGWHWGVHGEEDDGYVDYIVYKAFAFQHILRPPPTFVLQILLSRFPAQLHSKVIDRAQTIAHRYALPPPTLPSADEEEMLDPLGPPSHILDILTNPEMGGTETILDNAMEDFSDEDVQKVVSAGVDEEWGDHLLSDSSSEDDDDEEVVSKPKRKSKRTGKGFRAPSIQVVGGGDTVEVEDSGPAPLNLLEESQEVEELPRPRRSTRKRRAPKVRTPVDNEVEEDEVVQPISKEIISDSDEDPEFAPIVMSAKRRGKLPVGVSEKVVVVPKAVSKEVVLNSDEELEDMRDSVVEKDPEASQTPPGRQDSLVQTSAATSVATATCSSDSRSKSLSPSSPPSASIQVDSNLNNSLRQQLHSPAKRLKTFHVSDPSDSEDPSTPESVTTPSHSTLPAARIPRGITTYKRHGRARRVLPPGSKRYDIIETERKWVADSVAGNDMVEAGSEGRATEFSQDVLKEVPEDVLRDLMTDSEED
ncbi:hypothetical protein HDV05_007009 [Chytridiales sp. JEL 0842]|nr:hypothetical protein HDV05_007009 [Chytridiales sp. JEL 0842]